MASTDALDVASERSPLLSDRRDAVPHALTRPRFAILVACLLLASGLASLDSSIVVTLASPISSQFGHSSLYTTLGAAFVGAQCSLTPLFARASDTFGRRVVICTAATLFLAGTALCGLAQSFVQLLVGRAIAGAGAGGLTSLINIVLNDLVTPRRRGAYSSASMLVIAFGTAAGGPVGGILYDLVGWRGAFMLQLPFLVLSLVGFATLVRLPGTGRATIDWAGSASSIIAIGSFVTALQIGGSLLPWSSPIVLGGLVVSLVAGIAFVHIERRATAPIIRLDLLCNKTVARVAIANILGGAAVFALLWGSPTWYLTVLQMTPRIAGYHYAPVAASIAVGSIMAGVISVRTGSYRLGLVASVGYVISPIFADMWQLYTPGWRFYVDFIPLGLANGASLNSLYLAAIASVPGESRATVTGITSLSRTLGQIVGVSIAGAVLASQTRGFPDAWTAPLGPLPLEAILAYAHACRVLFRWVIGVSVLACIATLSVPSHELQDR